MCSIIVITQINGCTLLCATAQTMILKLPARLLPAHTLLLATDRSRAPHITVTMPTKQHGACKHGALCDVAFNVTFAVGGWQRGARHGTLKLADSHVSIRSVWTSLQIFVFSCLGFDSSSATSPMSRAMVAFTADGTRAMTVPRLHSELSLLCLVVSGRKTALVDRLIQTQIHHAESCEPIPNAANSCCLVWMFLAGNSPSSID